MVDMLGPAPQGSLQSEPVFSVSGLAAGVEHTLTIFVTGMADSLAAILNRNTYVAIDAFEIEQ
jgi:hypothetical protein